MSYYKQFKDPIYEYINIDNELVKKIIDTPTFQRLKDIRQTSYTSLFPGAYHNRYIHSLGVYHLGCIAFKSIENQLIEFSDEAGLKEDIDNIRRIFELACLLHDVGHAPFSHTGETFYLDENNTLYNLLKECVNDYEFSKDFDELGTNKPAPHECMSCIVGIKKFPENFINSYDKSFFARCIIGMPQKFDKVIPPYNFDAQAEERRKLSLQIKELEKERKKAELLNCIISLLNSSIIDVDRLDYIIRDAETIGFKNVRVDYKRLLNGLRIVQYKGKFCIGYHKSAISVIESAIYAHDAEKKWIQNHPSILYESECIKNAMGYLTKIFRNEHDINPIFCYEALTEEGKNLRIKENIFTEDARALLAENKLWSSYAENLAKENKIFSEERNYNPEEIIFEREYKISLLADEDFLYLMKQFCNDGLGYEYYARNKRKTAVWKSEAEFRALFQTKLGERSTTINKLVRSFEELANFCQNKTGSPILNNCIFDLLNKEKNDADKAKENEEIPDDYYEDIVRGVNTKIKLCRALKDALDKYDIEFECVVIFKNKFNSSFKSSNGNIPILFPNIEESVVKLEDVIDLINTTSSIGPNFFHLFYNASNVNVEENKRQIVTDIAQKLIECMNTF